MNIPKYKKVESDKFTLSPSSITQFMDNPKGWSDRYIDKVSSFEGNTNTVFGTVLHAGIEQHFRGVSLTRSDVIEYLDRQMCELDRSYILDCWGETLDVLKANTTKPDIMEYEVLTHLDYISVGGTVDYRRHKTIGDYKTCGSIKQDIGEYKYQLLTYAWIERQLGVDIDSLEVVYIQRPNRGYISEKTGKVIGIKPAKVETIRYEITDTDMEEIKELLLSVDSTIELVHRLPSLKSILFRENKLSYRK